MKHTGTKSCKNVGVELHYVIPSLQYQNLLENIISRLEIRDCRNFSPISIQYLGLVLDRFPFLGYFKGTMPFLECSAPPKRLHCNPSPGRGRPRRAPARFPIYHPMYNPYIIYILSKKILRKYCPYIYVPYIIYIHIYIYIYLIHLSKYDPH